MNSELIAKNLKHDSKISKIICLDTIDSTNNYAKKLTLSGASHGTLITSDQQTNGRGRFGHNFESPPETGLYMTLILKPETEISRFQFITIASAVAVCLAIEDLYSDSEGELKVKWVNDVYFRGKKITGILTEAVTNFENGKIESVITGIGVNISTKNFHGNFEAGSIFEEGENIIFGREELCAKISDYVMDMAEDLNNPEIINEYRKRSLLTGKNITYVQDGETKTAYVKGIDDSGGLIILNSENENEILRSGEVFTIRERRNE